MPDPIAVELLNCNIVVVPSICSLVDISWRSFVKDIVTTSPSVSHKINREAALEAVKYS